MKEKWIFSGLFLLSLFLNSVFSVSYPEMKSLLSPEIYDTYFSRALIHDISYEILCITCMWFLLGDKYSNVKKIVILSAIEAIFVILHFIA